MSLSRPWEDEYRRLLVELEQRWTQKSDSSTGPIGEARWQAVSWDEYPGFAGEREGDQFYVSLKADLMALSVFRDLEANIVIRPEAFLDRFLKAIWLDWEFQTGNPDFDREFYIDQFRTEGDKKLVCDPRFQKQVEVLMPFLSLAVTDKAAHLSLQIEKESQLTVAFLDDRLGCLSKLAKLVSEIASGGNRQRQEVEPEQFARIVLHPPPSPFLVALNSPLFYHRRLL